MASKQPLIHEETNSNFFKIINSIFDSLLWLLLFCLNSITHFPITMRQGILAAFPTLSEKQHIIAKNMCLNWSSHLNVCFSVDDLISEFLQSSEKCSSAELRALPAALRAETQQTALCRCCKLCGPERRPYEWRASTCAAPRRVTSLKTCEEDKRPPGLPLLVPTPVDPAQGTWWGWCRITCWWWRAVPPTARSRPGVDRWRSLAEDGNPDCTAPLAESQLDLALVAFWALAFGSEQGVHWNHRNALSFSWS